MPIYHKGNVLSGGGNGVGVPAGGTAGQVLAKVDDVDFNTEWIDNTPESVEQAEYLVKAPIGTIVIWSGDADSIPDGWALCDGTNGTPDLRNKFVLGAGDVYEIGATGGEVAHALTVNELAKHRHSEMAVSDLENPQQARFIIPNISGVTSPGLAINGTPFTAENIASAAISTEYEGKTQPHNNLPPYYALCYIMKIAPDPEADGVTQAELETALSTKMDAFEVGSSLELSANDGDAGGRLDVKHPVVPITKAEYDGLTTEQKNSETFWAITDDVWASGGSSEEIYSTEETRIGTWIDGKPLYRKVVKTKSSSAINTPTVVYEYPEYMSVVYIYGSININELLYNITFIAADNTNCVTIVDLQNHALKNTVSHTNYANRDMTIIIKYTKTTDTRG